MSRAKRQAILQAISALDGVMEPEVAEAAQFAQEALTLIMLSSVGLMHRTRGTSPLTLFDDIPISELPPKMVRASLVEVARFGRELAELVERAAPAIAAAVTSLEQARDELSKVPRLNLHEWELQSPGDGLLKEVGDHLDALRKIRDRMLAAPYPLSVEKSSGRPAEAIRRWIVGEVFDFGPATVDVATGILVEAGYKENDNGSLRLAIERDVAKLRKQGRVFPHRRRGRPRKTDTNPAS